MKITARRIFNTPYGIKLNECEQGDLKVTDNCYMFIDGSTSNTGIAIMRVSDSAIMGIVSAKADSQDLTPVHYKLAFKRFITELMLSNRGTITNIYYEEPIIRRKSAIPNLMMLRSTVPEVIIENGWDDVVYQEINNMTWKRGFLAPDKIPDGTDAQKEAVFIKLTKYIPQLSVITYDESDAIGMGTYVLNTLKANGMNPDSVKQHKKARPFKYNIKFLGGDEDECLEDAFELYTGPEYILDRGTVMAELGRKSDIEQFIYDTMGDEDIVIIIKMDAKKHGNIVLKYRLGALSSDYKYIYAIVWRVNRKKS